jgi:hypothetical protein
VCRAPASDHLLNMSELCDSHDTVKNRDANDIFWGALHLLSIALATVRSGHVPRSGRITFLIVGSLSGIYRVLQDVAHIRARDVQFSGYLGITETS